eukprot:344249_1
MSTSELGNFDEDALNSDMIQCTYLPPTFIQHMTAEDYRPDIYIYFWSIGGLMVLLTAILIIPRMMEFRSVGTKTRNDLNLILEPFSHTAYRLMVAFPLIASVLKYFTFLSPISFYSTNFLIHFYEGIILFFFAKLVIMYLGTLENSIDALKSHTPTKFYAVPPFGCCLKPCMAPSNMTHKNFRCLYYIILQYAILTPFFAYLDLMQDFQEHTVQVYFLTALELLCSMICIYGLFALMTAAHGILKQHKIHHKFWCIKLLVLFMVIPSLLVTYIGPVFPVRIAGENDMYSGDVMAKAYATFVQLILFTILAVFFRKYFNTEDAIYAHKNHKYKSHKVRYSKVDVTDNVPNFTCTDDEKDVMSNNDIELQNIESNELSNCKLRYINTL